jgi:hypothetical protein
MKRGVRIFICTFWASLMLNIVGGLNPRLHAFHLIGTVGLIIIGLLFLASL